MRRMVAILGGILVASFAGAGPANAAESGIDREIIKEEIAAWKERHSDDLNVYWKGGGPHLDAWGGRVKVSFGGRIMADFTFFDDADPQLVDALATPFASGFEFRRAWLRMNGQVTKYVGWMVQLALENPDLDLIPVLDVWVRIQNLEPWFGPFFPSIKLGHTQEPIGLAWLTSSKHFQLTAWPLPTTTFTPGYNSGVVLHSTGWGKRATAQLGWFAVGSGLKGDGLYEEGEAVTGRLTWLAWVGGDRDARLLHLGVGGSYRYDLRGSRFRSRADVDLGPVVVDTGVIDASQEFLVDVEVAFVWERFSIQAEGMWSHVDADTGSDPEYWGWYVQASWLIGGRSRKYSRNTGVFAGIEPCVPSDGTKGKWGALELVARVDGVDLDDGEDWRGGRCQDVVFGVNWWLNANAGIMLNWVHARVEGAVGAAEPGPSGDGAVNALVLRFRVHW